MLLVGLDPEAEARLLPVLGTSPVERCAADPASLADALSRLRPAAAVVALSPRAADPALGLVRQAASSGARVAVLCPERSAELLLRAMRSGAQEFLVPGEEPALAAALRAAAESGRGSVVAVLGAKGGLGATVVAAHLAGALVGKGGARACLVDLDQDSGDALAALDLSCKFDLYDLDSNLHRLDRELLDASLARHRGGFFVVGQGERAEPSRRLPATSARRLLTFLREQFRHVVLDGLRGTDGLAGAALPEADAIVLLVTQEVVAVRGARRTRDLLDRLGCDEARVKLVVNRFHKAARIGLSLLSDTVGLPVAATLANDFHSLGQAVQHGALVFETAPRSPLSRDLAALAAALPGSGSGGGAPVPSQAARPLWARLLSRG
jgi:pilus assembly protein CpaE